MSEAAEQQLLEVFAATPTKTGSHISSLPPPIVAHLLSRASGNPLLLPALWTRSPLRAELLALQPPPPSLSRFLLSLAHASDSLHTRLRSISAAGTAALRAQAYEHLLPLVQAASALPGRRARHLRTRLLDVFLAGAPARASLVEPLLETPLPRPAYRDAVAFIHAAVVAAPPTALTSLVGPLVAALPVLPVARPLVAVLARADDAILVALEVAILDRPSHAVLVSTMLVRALRARVAVTTGLLHSLFCLLAHPAPDIAHPGADALENLLLDPRAVFRVPAAGSSTDPCSAAFAAAVRAPAMRPRAQPLLAFAEGLIWKSSPALRAHGAALLREMFTWLPEARDPVVNASLAALTESAPHDVHATYLALFEDFARTPPTSVAMRESTPALLDALTRLQLMPPGVDVRFMAALSGVLIHTPTARDKLILFLRKITGSRAARQQRVACSGLLAVVDASDVPDELLSDAADMLALLVVSAQNSVRNHLLYLVLDMIRRSPSRKTRIRALSCAVERRLFAVENCARGEHSADSRAGRMDLCRYYSLIAGDYLLQDPVPLLFRFYAAVSDTRNSDFVARFLAYLKDAHGALRHASLLSHSPVPVTDRLHLLVGLIETFLGLDIEGVDETIVKVYAAAIAIRDVMLTTTGDGTLSDPDRRTSLKPDYDTMTAREAVLQSNQVSVIETEMKGQWHACALRLQALRVLEKIPGSKAPALRSVVSCELLTKLEGDFRDVTISEKTLVSLDTARQMLFFIRKYFTLSDPLEFQEGSRRTLLSENGAPRDSSVSERGAGGVESVFPLSVEHEFPHIFNPKDLERRLERARVRVRESTLSILRGMLAGSMVEDDAAFLLSLTERTSFADCDQDKSVRDSNETERGPRSKNLLASKSEGKRVLATRRLTNLFRQEFANSLTISLTLSYLDILARIVDSSSQHTEEATTVRNLVSDSVTGFLREYAIRHLSVIRSMLKLLMKTFDAAGGLKFAKSVLGWLGNGPCLLNSKFVVAEDELKQVLRVNDFDADIIAEAIAIDTGDIPEINSVASSDHLQEAVPSEIPAQSINTTSENHGDPESLQLSLRVNSTADPAKSLCLDETPEVALLAVLLSLELCERVLEDSMKRYQRCQQSTTKVDRDENCSTLLEVSDIIDVFTATAFMQTFKTNVHSMPHNLMKRIASIAQKLLENIQVGLRFILKEMRDESRNESATEFESIRHFLEAAKKGLSVLYKNESSNEILSGCLHADNQSKRGFIQEQLNVSVATLLRLSKTKKSRLDDETRKAVSELAAAHQSCGSRLRNVPTVKQLWASSEGGLDLDSGDYFHPARPKKRQRLRSRNRNVDEWLREETDGDNYADLEDFVVAMDADEL